MRSEDASDELGRYWRWRFRDFPPWTGGSGAVTAGATNAGGASNGGMATGGMATGGMATGGMATGGMATGGTATGGTATGGTATGGVASGGTSAFGVAVKFKPPNAPDVLGYVQDVGDVFGSRGNGHTYGWNASHRERGVYAELIAGYGWAFPTWSHIVMLPGETTTWEIVVPNGTYSVLVQGNCDEGGSTPAQRIEVENELVVDFVPKVGCYDIYTAYASKVVVVNDGRLTITNGAGATANAIEYITISER